MSHPSNTQWRPLGIGTSMSLLLFGLCLFALQQPVYAAPNAQVFATAGIQVTTTNPAIAVDGQCSLIEAIVNANDDAATHADCAAGAGADAISLPSDAVLIFSVVDNSVDGNNGLPSITGVLTIVGNNAALVRNTGGAIPEFRFFHVAQGAALTLIELNLRQGAVDPTGTNQLILGGGAILNRGTVAIEDSNISFNRAGYGGAIYHAAITGTLSLVDTTFTSNRASLFGGAIYSEGRATIQGGQLRLNQATTGGGAILHTSAVLTITNATLRDNTTNGVGAGVAAYAALADSQVLIQGATVISNVAVLNGGGLVNSAAGGFSAEMTVVGSSITLNRALSDTVGHGYGGGIVNGWLLPGSAGTAELTVRQSTLADNGAQSGGGIANLDLQGYPTRTVSLTLVQSTLARNGAEGAGAGHGTGGGLLNQNAAAAVGNSTFSANYAEGADADTGGRGGAIGSSATGMPTTLQVVNATLTLNRAAQGGGAIALLRPFTGTRPTLSLGNSLIQANVLTGTSQVTTTLIITGTENCDRDNGVVTSLGNSIEDANSCDLDASGDLKDTVVALGPLANNGGPTLTHLIFAPGVAFNEGSNALCAAAPVNNVDQRGITRPQGSSCDIGAVELSPGFLSYLMPIIFGKVSEVLPEARESAASRLP